MLIALKAVVFTDVLKGTVGQKSTLLNLRHSGLFSARGKMA